MVVGMAKRPALPAPALAIAAVGVVIGALAGLPSSEASYTSARSNGANAYSTGSLPAPGALSCAWTGTNSIGLTWSQTSALASGYTIERSNSLASGYATLTTTSPASTVTASDSNPLPPTLRYYRVNATAGTAWVGPSNTPIASNACSSTVLAVATITDPVGVAVDSSGNVYTSSSANDRVYRTTPGGSTTTFAGTGVGGYSGNGGPATSAQIDNPKDLAIDAAGNLYFAEEINDVIRKVTPAGIISTVAGTGVAGYLGDGGAATSARLNAPFGLHVASDGTIYIADRGNQVVRKVSPGGTITTVAGNGSAGFSGDGGAATSAQLSGPYDITVDSSGNFYVADTDNDAIRRVTPGGTISTIAGRGVNASCSYSGAANTADFTQPKRLTYDAGTNRIFVPDSSHNCVRVITGATTVGPLAGTGTYSMTGDNGPASAATFQSPLSTYLHTDGTLYIGEAGGYVRKVLDA